jgi:hypothetical protein
LKDLAAYGSLPGLSFHVSVEKVIETGDGYILIGSVKPQVPEGSWIQVTEAATIRDANGKKVSYS